MIHIIDYGLGNIQAFLNVYKRLGIAAARASNPGEIAGASHLILPGVGSFDRAMNLFRQSGFAEPVEAMVCQNAVKILGICVGMQMLADGSDEGLEPGLGWIPGRVRHFDRLLGAQGLAKPHMGWNDVQPTSESPLFRQMVDARFYFLHSYYYECVDSSSSMASATYGSPFSCAVQQGNVMGVQFHPEKSHHWGQTLLQNFAQC